MAKGNRLLPDGFANNIPKDTKANTRDMVQQIAEVISRNMSGNIQHNGINTVSRNNSPGSSTQNVVRQTTHTAKTAPAYDVKTHLLGDDSVIYLSKQGRSRQTPRSSQNSDFSSFDVSQSRIAQTLNSLNGESRSNPSSKPKGVNGQRTPVDKSAYGQNSLGDLLYDFTGEPINTRDIINQQKRKHLALETQPTNFHFGLQMGTFEKPSAAIRAVDDMSRLLAPTFTVQLQGRDVCKAAVVQISGAHDPSLFKKAKDHAHARLNVPQLALLIPRHAITLSNINSYTIKPQKDVSIAFSHFDIYGLPDPPAAEKCVHPGHKGEGTPLGVGKCSDGLVLLIPTSNNATNSLLFVTTAKGVRRHRTIPHVEDFDGTWFNFDWSPDTSVVREEDALTSLNLKLWSDIGTVHIIGGRITNYNLTKSINRGLSGTPFVDSNGTVRAILSGYMPIRMLSKQGDKTSEVQRSALGLRYRAPVLLLVDKISTKGASALAISPVAAPMPSDEMSSLVLGPRDPWSLRLGYLPDDFPTTIGTAPVPHRWFGPILSSDPYTFKNRGKTQSEKLLAAGTTAPREYYAHYGSLQYCSASVLRPRSGVIWALLLALTLSLRCVDDVTFYEPRLLSNVIGGTYGTGVSRVGLCASTSPITHGSSPVDFSSLGLFYLDRENAVSGSAHLSTKSTIAFKYEYNGSLELRYSINFPSTCHDAAIYEIASIHRCTSLVSDPGSVACIPYSTNAVDLPTSESSNLVSIPLPDFPDNDVYRPYLILSISYKDHVTNAGAYLCGTGYLAENVRIRSYPIQIHSISRQPTAVGDFIMMTKVYSTANVTSADVAEVDAICRESDDKFLFSEFNDLSPSFCGQTGWDSSPTDYTDCSTVSGSDSACVVAYRHYTGIYPDYYYQDTVVLLGEVSNSVSAPATYHPATPYGDYIDFALVPTTIHACFCEQPPHFHSNIDSFTADDFGYHGECSSGLVDIPCGGYTCPECLSSLVGPYVTMTPSPEQGLMLLCDSMSSSLSIDCGHVYDCAMYPIPYAAQISYTYGSDKLVVTGSCLDGLSFTDADPADISCCAPPEVYTSEGLASYEGGDGRWYIQCLDAVYPVECDEDFQCPVVSCVNPIVNNPTSDLLTFMITGDSWGVFCNSLLFTVPCGGVVDCSCDVSNLNNIEDLSLTMNEEKTGFSRMLFKCNSDLHNMSCGESFDCCRSLASGIDPDTRLKQCSHYQVYVPCDLPDINCDDEIPVRVTKTIADLSQESARYPPSPRLYADTIDYDTALGRASCDACEDGNSCLSTAGPLFVENGPYFYSSGELRHTFLYQLATVGDVTVEEASTNLGDCTLVEHSKGMNVLDCPVYLAKDTSVTLWVGDSQCTTPLKFSPVASEIGSGLAGSDIPCLTFASSTNATTSLANSIAVVANNPTLTKVDGVIGQVAATSGLSFSPDSTTSWFMLSRFDNAPLANTCVYSDSSDTIMCLTQGQHFSDTVSFGSLIDDSRIIFFGSIGLYSASLDEDFSEYILNTVSADSYNVRTQDYQTPGITLYTSAPYFYSTDTCVIPDVRTDTYMDHISISTDYAALVLIRNDDGEKTQWVHGTHNVSIDGVTVVKVGSINTLSVYPARTIDGHPSGNAFEVFKFSFAGGIIGLLALILLCLLVFFIVHCGTAIGVRGKLTSAISHIKTPFLRKSSTFLLYVFCLGPKPTHAGFLEDYFDDVKESVEDMSNSPSAYDISHLINLFTGPFLLIVALCVLVILICKCTKCFLSPCKRRKSSRGSKASGQSILPGRLVLSSLLFAIASANTVSLEVSTAVNAPQLCGSIDKSGYETLQYCVATASSTRSCELRHDYITSSDEVYVADAERACSKRLELVSPTDIPSIANIAVRTDACSVSVFTDVADMLWWHGDGGCASEGFRNSQLDAGCCALADSFRRDYTIASKCVDEIETNDLIVTTWSASVPKKTTTITVKDTGYSTSIEDRYEILATGARFEHDLPEHILLRIRDGALSQVVDYEYPQFGSPAKGSFGSIQIPYPLPPSSNNGFSYYADCGLTLQQPPLREKVASTHFTWAGDGYMNFWSNSESTSAHSHLEMGYNGCEVSVGDDYSHVSYNDCPSGFISIDVTFPNSMFVLQTPDTPEVTSCSCKANSPCVADVASSGSITISGYSTAASDAYITSADVFFDNPLISVSKGEFEASLHYSTSSLAVFDKVSVAGCDASCATTCDLSDEPTVFRDITGSLAASNPYGSHPSTLPSFHKPWYLVLIGSTGGIVLIIVIAALLFSFFNFRRRRNVSFITPVRRGPLAFANRTHIGDARSRGTTAV